jgi:hypothetical protein
MEEIYVACKDPTRIGDRHRSRATDTFTIVDMYLTTLSNQTRTWAKIEMENGETRTVARARSNYGIALAQATSPTVNQHHNFREYDS